MERILAGVLVSERQLGGRDCREIECGVLWSFFGEDFLGEFC